MAGCAGSSALFVDNDIRRAGKEFAKMLLKKKTFNRKYFWNLITMNNIPVRPHNHITGGRVKNISQNEEEDF